MAQDIKLTLSTHLEDLGCSGQPIAEQGSRADVEVDNTGEWMRRSGEESLSIRLTYVSHRQLNLKVMVMG